MCWLRVFTVLILAYAHKWIIWLNLLCKDAEDLSFRDGYRHCIILISALQKKPEEINRRSSDMWSFAILLWELVTREVPFADLSNMEIGMKVCKPLFDSTS